MYMIKMCALKEHKSEMDMDWAIINKLNQLTCFCPVQ